MILGGKDRMLVTNENGKWFGYGLDANNNIIGCVEIAPPSCKSFYEVFQFVKQNISPSTFIEKISSKGEHYARYEH